jgi:hypothetical protein
MGGEDGRRGGRALDLHGRDLGDHKMIDAN